jgi:hypothetical protein
MRDFLEYVRLTARLLVRNDAWLLALPILLIAIVGLWTGYFVETAQWKPGIAITQAEVFGPFAAVFMFAGLLDAEHRRGVGEIVFCKPHSPLVLLGVRIVLALLFTLAMLLGLLVAYQFRYGNGAIARSLLHAVPPCLFIGAIALTAGTFARSAAAGYGFALGFWLWDSTAGILYNPLFVLPAAAMGTEAPGGSVPVALAANKGAMLLLALLLFGVNARRLGKGGL